MTSKPLHVRLAILTDADGIHCGPCMRRKGELCDMFGGILAHDPEAGWERRGDCLKSATADALNAAVVEAAERMRASYSDGNHFVGSFDYAVTVVVEAVDALRTAERKEKR